MDNEGQRDFFRLIAGYLVPPVGVAMQEGFNGVLVLNLLLTLCCYVPGQIHAAWIITRRDSDGGYTDGGTGRFVSVVLSFFLPPVGVFLTRGIGVPLLINILLTLMLYVPGAIHATWEIATSADDGGSEA